METKKVESDVLIIGGGMAGTGAAYEARYWGPDLKIVMVEKANIDRSGAVAQGLSAINCFMGTEWGENTPEDFVKYVRSDLMGITREDLVYDIGRHVDSTVHLFEEWGLPIIHDPETGRYKREGRFQVLIHGESYKPIVAEAARKAVSEIYERVMITHLLTDRNNPNRVVGAVGFNVRDGTFYQFHSKVVIVAAGGATHIFRPHSIGEGAGRTWYSPWSSGSAYGLLIPIGAEMTLLENKLVVSRFKDGYGPVGMWFLVLKTQATNSKGELYEKKNVEDQRKLFGNYVDSKPFPTCLRNDSMLREINAGKSPILMHTEDVLDTEEKESEGWEDFLDMTISQAITWAAQGIDPKKEPSELVLTEPYVMGSHAAQAGAWVSGPADIGPDDYHWGYNRMTTVEGLFGAGDTVGGNGHKFSSGSFTEGRIAAKSAIKYIKDHEDQAAEADESRIQELKQQIYMPLENNEYSGAIVAGGTVSPICLAPNSGLQRLEKIMGEYCGGHESNYATNKDLLERGIRLLGMLHEDLAYLCASDYHQLQRSWELHHRVWTAESLIRHTLAREETRWPVYSSRADFPSLDDESWHVFVNTRYDPKTNEWSVYKRPVRKIVEEEVMA